MAVVNVNNMVENGYKVFGSINQYLNIKQRLASVQAALQHPVVVGFHVLKNVKHCCDVVPATCKNWRDLFKLAQRVRDLRHSFGAEAELVKLRVLYKVVVVTGSFLCIMGALGQFGFVNFPRLYIVARVVDLIGLGLLLIEPWVAHRLQKKEKEAEARLYLLEAEACASERFNPYSTNSSQERLLFEDLSQPNQPRQVERDVSYARMQLDQPCSYTNIASYACYFVARAMHLVAMCIFVNCNRKWVIAGTILETAGLVCAFLSPVRTSYRWVCQLQADSRCVNLFKRVLAYPVHLVRRVFPSVFAPQHR